MPRKRPGARGLLEKATCAARARLPWLLCRRRTVRGVAAYFDLITEDGGCSSATVFMSGSSRRRLQPENEPSDGHASRTGRRAARAPRSSSDPYPHHVLTA
jgi:hypothetical protein